MKTVLTLVAASVLAGLTAAQGQISTNLPPTPAGFATRLDYVRSFTTEKSIIDAYHAGRLSKDEAVLALGTLGNKAPMDIYGKVVDQDGQPITGVSVQGVVGLGMGDTEKHGAKTDAGGLINLLGLHGQKLTVELYKDGYYFDYMLPSAHRPENYLPDPNNPLIFTMWKLRGAEPMTHSKINSDVPCDGSVASFDLLRGKKDSDGDLRVKLTRNPLIIDRRKPFDWSVTLEITNGGLQAVTNLYPNEAPADGYQPILTLDFPTNSTGWKNEINDTYYFKSKGGQVYDA